MMYGEIWWVDFGIPFGSETGFKRPSIIVQSDSFNQTAMNTTILSMPAKNFLKGVLTFF